MGLFQPYGRHRDGDRQAGIAETLSAAFTYYSRQHVTAALEAAAAIDRRVTLVTPPNGATSAGPEVYFEMIQAGRADVPQASADAIVDCGSDAGTVMRALRCGWRTLRYSGDRATHAKLAEMANQLGGTIERALPATIDLHAARDPSWFCRHTLSATNPTQ